MNDEMGKQIKGLQIRLLELARESGVIGLPVDEQVPEATDSPTSDGQGSGAPLEVGLLALLHGVAREHPTEAGQILQALEKLGRFVQSSSARAKHN